MAVIGSLSVKLGLVTVEWDQATAKAKQQAKDLQKSFDSLTSEVKTLYGHWKTLGGALSVGSIGMAALMQQTLEFANQIKDLAKGFDLSIAKVLQFQDAIKTSGGSAEGAARMLSTLFGKIEDAQKGNETAIAQFEHLGISFKELATLKPEEAIDRFFKAISSQSLTTYQRVKAVKEMLGKTGIGVAVDEVSAKLNMSVEAYRKNEAAIKKLGDVSDNLKTSMDNLKLAFADVISPLARDGLITVDKFKAGLYAIGSVYLISQMMKLYEVFMLIRKALIANAALTAGIGAMGGAKGLGLAAAGFATYKTAMALFEGQQPPSASDEAKQNDEQSKAEREKALEANRREIIAAQAKVDLAKELTEYEDQLNKLKISSLNNDKYKNDLAAIEVQRKIELAMIENARAQALNKENLSEDQKRLINEDYDQQREKADQKARNDSAFLRENDLKILTALANQIEFKEKLNKLDDEAGRLRVESVGMDKLKSELLSLELQRKTELLRIDEQEKASLDKANQTDSEKLAIRRNADLDRESAQQRFLNGRNLVIKTYQQELDAIARTMQAQEAVFDLDVKSQVLEQNRYQMRDTDVRLTQEKIDLERKLVDLRKQQEDALARLGQGDLYQAEYNRIQNLIDAETALSKARQKNIIDEEARRKSFTEGFESTVRQFAIDAENYGKLGADLFSSAIGNMNSAIDNFVKTGKLGFKDFAKSVIQDILAMMMKFQAMQLTMAGLRALGFGSFAAPMMGAPVSSGILPVTPAFAAAGGEIDGPTIVGENGPELFIPQRRGTVIPNLQASSMMQPQAQTVFNGPYINSMSAIDTQSAVQFLAQNKQAVWAANQSAQRSLPVSR